MRRRRMNQCIRDMCAESALSVNNLVQPYFIVGGCNKIEPIDNFPNVSRYSIDHINEQIQKSLEIGVNKFILFPAVSQDCKSLFAEESYNPENLICKAIREIKTEFKDEVCVITDVALDPYTTHGHDGIINDSGDVENDKTVEILCKQAIVQAASGSDIIAPSDMMDGRIGEIRSSLDTFNMQDKMILSYAAKYASNLYGPFRNAVASAQTSDINKKTYQMDYRNSDEALLEAQLDIEEGADMIMVKPASLYLDIIHKMKCKFPGIPIWAYQVSGEYAMMHNDPHLLLESLISARRAGATNIISYGISMITDLLS